MNSILKRKLKIYTKETLKIFNIAIIAFAIITAIILLKYKPMYEVTLSGEEIGYVKSKDEFQEVLNKNIENYSAKNVEEVTLETKPEYTLKLVEKSEKANESDILIAVQKDFKIKYQYYEIVSNGEVIDSVDSQEEAENLVTELKKEKTELNIEIIKRTTEEIEKVKTNEVEVAKQNIEDRLGLNKEETVQNSQVESSTAIANVNGIEIATLPVQGTITSRYGVRSRIRVSTHTGLDIAATKGTSIKALADGTVTSASYNGSYGNLVKISHGNNVETWYAHTSKMYVKVGQKVSAGDVIAKVGSTGNSTGPHLHLEIRINGKHVNPQNYIY